ncbi:MAG: tyrosine-protein phosphatase, partial [Oscillospiraceae bacterium]|nr:tyrosine-protein phosphatase [Oscillospiraceae bacterium]
MFLEFEGIENVRDLGGLLRADGARTRRGLLLRSGRLENATDGDLQRLAEMGLSAVVDFRDGGELDRSPDRQVPGAVFRHLPALPKLQENFRRVDDPTYTAEELHNDFRRIYRLLAQSTEAEEAYAAFFRILLASEGRPVLWHCTQGKDRTGVAALLLLTAL